MKKLIRKIGELKKSPISKVVGQRIKEFENVSDLFGELCFCLMTANFKAEESIRIQKEIGGGFSTLSQEELAALLKKMGHRFWPQRAERIVLARSHNLNEIKNMKSEEARNWLVQNVRGLGLKEASHFLRNVGRKDVAIVDFHIVDLLHREGLIGEGREKGMTSRRYLAIEEVLKKLAEELGLNLAELDLYLWYLETGKVLK